MPKIIEKIFSDKKWKDLCLEEDLKKIGKFLYLENKEDKSRIFICANSPHISNHSDIAYVFKYLEIGDFANDFNVIGAGEMHNSTIESFRSVGFGIDTDVGYALEIIDVLGGVKLIGRAEYQYKDKIAEYMLESGKLKIKRLIGESGLKPECISYDFETGLDKLSKFLYIENKSENSKILLCLSKNFINFDDHLKLLEIDLNDDNYSIIGAGDINDLKIVTFQSTDYDFQTEGQIAIEMFELLKKPGINDKMISFLNESFRSMNSGSKKENKFQLILFLYIKF